MLPQDSLLMPTDSDGLRRYCCLRCDSWLPLLVPPEPAPPNVPDRDEIVLRMRGKTLRDLTPAATAVGLIPESTTSPAGCPH